MQGQVAARSRLVWPDLAKGVCILLVVLHHATTKHYVDVLPAGLAPVGELWAGLSHALKPIRMPLFFVISGWFAASALHRPWSAVIRRVVSPYYLYVVWLVLLAGVFAVERTLPMNRTQDVREFGLDLLFASTGLWFLYALAVYFVIAKLLVGVDGRWLLATAAMIALATSAMPLPEVNRASVVFHFVYFIAGSRFPGVVRRVAAERRRWVLPVLVAGYVGLSLLLVVLPVWRSAHLLALSAIGVPAAVMLAVSAARSTGWAERAVGSVARLGRNTLPVYVLHMPVLAVLAHLPAWPTAESGPVPMAVAVGYPVVLTLLIAAVSLAIHAGLRRGGAGLLFEPPVALVTALGQRDPRATVASRRLSTMILALRPAATIRSRVVAD